MPIVASGSRYGMRRNRAVIGSTAMARSLRSPSGSLVEASSSAPSLTPPLAEMPLDTSAGDVIILIRHAENPIATLARSALPSTERQAPGR